MADDFFALFSRLSSPLFEKLPVFLSPRRRRLSDSKFTFLPTFPGGRLPPSHAPQHRLFRRFLSARRFTDVACPECARAARALQDQVKSVLRSSY